MLKRNLMRQIALESQSAALSQEAIAFQDKEFGEKLEEGFQLVLDAKTDDELIAATMVIVKATRERTGIRIILTIDPKDFTMGSYTQIPMFNNSHIFIHPYFQGAMSKDHLENIHLLRKFTGDSFVDLKNARVGGFFSEITSPINMSLHSFFTMGGKQGMTALYLHELGHIFTTYELFARSITTNHALAAVLKSFNENGLSNHEKHIYTIKEIGKAMGENEEFFAELEGVTDRTVITTVVLSKTMTELKSNSGSSVYDQTTCEALADGFAARFGYGREAVLRLAAMSKAVGGAPYSSFTRITSHVMQITNLVLQPILAILTVASFPYAMSLIFLGLTIAGFRSTAIKLSGASAVNKNYTYDDLRVRFIRIKEQIVDGLKSKAIDPKFKKKLLDQISNIEKEINKVKEHREIYNIFADYVFPSSRRERKAILLQRKLESMAANDVFVKAAQISLFTQPTKETTK